MDASTLVFGLSGLLILVCFLSPLASLLRLPNALLLSAVGALLGYLIHTNQWAPAWLGDYLTSLQAFEIPSDTILVVFLPVLLFETALAMNVRRMMGDLAPILLLAVVAVLICTIFVGFGVSRISNFSVAVCLLLGAIIATTDPAAVVSIFKEVGAPKRLTTIVEGESLLNDAAAIALYSVMLGIVASGGTGGWAPGSMALTFLDLLVGGAFCGFIIGHIACAALPLLRGWPSAEISLTVAMAYLSYIIAEQYFEVSGVVSTVVAGLVVGSVGRTRVTPTTFYAMAESWKQFGFWATSLVFVFAAMMIPRLMADATWMHLGIVAMMMLMALLARMVTVFGLLPLLTAAVGTRVDNRYKTVICWGGLRGALSLALALAVTEHRDLPSDVRSFVAIGATGFVLSSLMINGLTLRPLIRLLGLDKLTTNERALRNQALVITVSELQKETERIAVDEQISRSARQRISHVFDASVTSISDAQIDQFSHDDRVQLGLSMVVKREFELFFAGLREQGFDARTAERLLVLSERLEDQVKANGLAGFEQGLRRSLDYPRVFRLMLYINQFVGVQRWLGRALSQRFVELVGIRWATRRLLVFADQKTRPMIGDAATESITQCLRMRLQLVDENMQAMRLQYPAFAQWLEENYLGKLARTLERSRYRQMLSDSLISGEVYDALMAQLDDRWYFLDQQAPLDIELASVDLVHKVPLLSALSDQALRPLVKSLRTRLAMPNELIQGPSKPNPSLYFVASGAVSVLLPDATHIELGSGEFFSELYLLKPDAPEFEVRSLGYTKLLELSAKDFKNLVASDSQLREAIEKVAKERLRALEVGRSSLT